MGMDQPLTPMQLLKKYKLLVGAPQWRATPGFMKQATVNDTASGTLRLVV